MNVGDEDKSNAVLPKLPERVPRSHKGDYGRALLLGGSSGMPGAISLAGMACLRIPWWDCQWVEHWWALPFDQIPRNACWSRPS